MEYTKEETLKVINQTIKNCSKMLDKFNPNKPQYSLLVNRIKALNVAKGLIEENNNISKIEIERALKPIESIIMKLKKAQEKYDINTKQYKKFLPLLNEMYVAKYHILQFI